MFIPDSSAKTVKIPARFVDGNLINSFTEQPINCISNESFCEIVTYSSNVKDKNLLEVLKTEETKEFLPKETELLVSVSRKSIPEELDEHAKRPNNVIFGSKVSFVSIFLRTPLLIKFCGTKQPSLLDCNCFIPSLNESADSLNHAYTTVSRAFERHRRNPGGNVFQRILYLSNKDDYTKNCWIELEHLRNEEVKKFYNYLSGKIQPSEETLTNSNFNDLTYELLKPFFITTLREFNQDYSNSKKVIETLLFVLVKKYKYTRADYESLKPYLLQLMADLKDGSATIL